MKKKIKVAWKKVQTFFKNSICRLFTGAILFIIAVLIRAGLVEAYVGEYAALVISIVWIILAIFYFAMYLWAVATR